MVKIRSNLKQRFVVLTLLINTLFISYFLIKNTKNTFNQIIVKEINIEADNEK